MCVSLLTSKIFLKDTQFPSGFYLQFHCVLESLNGILKRDENKIQVPHLHGQTMYPSNVLLWFIKSKTHNGVDLDHDLHDVSTGSRYIGLSCLLFVVPFLVLSRCKIKYILYIVIDVTRILVKSVLTFCSLNFTSKQKV